MPRTTCRSTRISSASPRFCGQRHGRKVMEALCQRFSTEQAWGGSPCVPTIPPLDAARLLQSHTLQLPAQCPRGRSPQNGPETTTSCLSGPSRCEGRACRRAGRASWLARHRRRARATRSVWTNHPGRNPLHYHLPRSWDTHSPSAAVWLEWSRVRRSDQPLGQVASSRMRRAA